MNNLDDAMLFVQVVQAGNFTQAANRLMSSKSQISRRIAKLEQQLDVILFTRNSRVFKLTPAGEKFYATCLKIQQDFQAATESLRNVYEQVSGRVNISAPMTLGTEVIGPLLSKLLKLYPQLDITLDLSDTVKNMDKEGIDIAIRAAAQLPDSSHYAKKLFTYGYCVTASPVYLAEYGEPAHPNELINHRCINCLTSHLTSGQWPFWDGKKIAQFPISANVEVTHMKVQREMALSGVGLIRTPEYWVQAEIENGKLVEVLPEFSKDLTSNIFAVYRNPGVLPGRIKAILDYLSHHMKQWAN